MRVPSSLNKHLAELEALLKIQDDATKAYENPLDSIYDDLSKITGKTSKSQSQKSTLTITNEFKEFLDEFGIFDNWVHELKNTNSYLNEEKKEKLVDYIQAFINEKKFKSVIQKSFIYPLSLKGAEYWDDIIEQVEHKEAKKSVKKEDPLTQALMSRALMDISASMK